MRTLVIITMVLSFSAFAQTRVKENIKQRAVTTSEDGAPRVVKPTPRPGKPVKSR